MNKDIDRMNFFVIDALIFTMLMSACIVTIAFAIIIVKMLFGLIPA